MNALKNDNLDYTTEEIQYFVDNYLNRIKLTDQVELRKQIASEMGRSNGAISWKCKHALWFLTNGEEGKPNGPKYLATYLKEYQKENSMSAAKMAYWFE